MLIRLRSLSWLVLAVWGLQGCSSAAKNGPVPPVYPRQATRTPIHEPAEEAYRDSAPAAAPAPVPAPGLRLRGAPLAEAVPQSESYARIRESQFQDPRTQPVSTFSIDVDTASYANVRRFLREGRLPPADAVRIEELLNYFRYDLPEPRAAEPVAALAEVGPCPWLPQHRLVRIGLHARSLSPRAVPPRNLVFLIDVSGSMNMPAKLPLLQQSLRLLVKQLRPEDRVAIVVYAGSEGLVLPSTAGASRSEIRDAVDRLQAGGSTNGGAGITLAYRVARDAFIAGGVNRVILATDGDFNVGVSSTAELVRMVEAQRASGIGLSVLGFGTGNLRDEMLEQLADRGNGNYAYIDSLDEARKVLVEEVAGTLVTVAHDVKVQVEFNPREVESYRLIGYENRALEREDFEDDRVDAGEMGAGHAVIALYEVAPRGTYSPARDVSPLRYQEEPLATQRAARSGELLWLKVRYKPEADAESRLLELPARDSGLRLASMSPDFRFASAVAAFGMVLRGSEYRGSATPELVRELASDAIERGTSDEYRQEFLTLVATAGQLWAREDRLGERGAPREP